MYSLDYLFIKSPFIWQSGHSSLWSFCSPRGTLTFWHYYMNCTLSTKYLLFWIHFFFWQGWILKSNFSLWVARNWNWQSGTQVCFLFLFLIVVLACLLFAAWCSKGNCLFLFKALWYNDCQLYPIQVLYRYFVSLFCSWPGKV